jgi:hypothetical protein
LLYAMGGTYKAGCADLLPFAIEHPAFAIVRKTSLPP